MGEGSVGLHSVNSHCATCQAQRKQNPPTQPAGRDRERRALQGPAAGAGARRAPSLSHSGRRPVRRASRAAPGARTPARRRPAAAAYRGASQLPPRRPSTAAAVRAPPRGGARLARPQLPAPPQRRRSREKLARTRRGGGGGRAGLPTAAATSAPHPEGRPPLCFVADFSARSPRTEPSEEGGGGVAAASATLPAECQVEEGKERRRRRQRRWWGRGALECGPLPLPHPGTPGAGRADGACPSGTRDCLGRRAAVVWGRSTRDFGFPAPRSR